MKSSKEEGLVERLFVASLHRSIEDLAPEQLEVFVRWFDPTDRRPRFHIAPVIGAVGFLRKNPTTYPAIMEQAGRYASEWSYSDLSKLERSLLESASQFGRELLLRHLLRSGLRCIHRDGRLQLQRAGSRLHITVWNSLFCRAGTISLIEPVCSYYAALFAGLLEQANGGYSSVIESKCRGQGEEACAFEVHR